MQAKVLEALGTACFFTYGGFVKDKALIQVYGFTHVFVRGIISSESITSSCVCVCW